MAFGYARMVERYSLIARTHRYGSVGPDKTAEPADPSERVPWFKQDWFFNDGNSPAHKGAVGRVTERRCKAVLADWGVVPVSGSASLMICATAPFHCHSNQMRVMGQSTIATSARGIPPSSHSPIGIVRFREKRPTP
jgi:hypothetical protein